MPSYVIGLDLGASCVKAAVLKGSLRGYEVEDFLSLDWEEGRGEAGGGAAGQLPVPMDGRDDPGGQQAPEEGAAEGPDQAGGGDGQPAAAAVEPMPVQEKEPEQTATARKVMEAARRPGALVVVSLPAGRASAWQVAMPFSDRKRIERTIRFELENYVPWDLDDVVLDWDVMPGGGAGTKVFAVMVPQERLRELLARMRSLSVDPRYVAVDAAELARLRPQSSACEAIVDVGASRTLLCVARESRALWIRSLDTGARDMGPDGDMGPLLRQIRASLLAAEESGAPAIEGVHLCGGGSRRAGLADAMAEDLGVPVQAIELPRSPVNPDTAPCPDPEHALCYALALKGFAAKGMAGTSLRRGEFAWKADSRLYTRLGFAAVAAILLLGAGLLAMHLLDLSDLRTRLQAAETSLSSTVLGTFPQVSPAQLMTPDGAIQVVQEQVTAVQWRVDALKGPPMTPLEALKELSETVPSDITVDVDEYLADAEALRLRGETDSFGSVDRIEAAILGNPKFAGAKKSDVNKSREGKMRFVLTIPRVPEEPEVEE